MPSSRSSPSPSEGARSESDIEQQLSQQLSADIKLHGAKVSFSDDDSEEDSDDQDILKPRGKLAARMQAKTADSRDHEDEVLPTRRKLQPRKRSTTPNSPDRPRAGTPEEEDDLFVTPSKPQPTATATANSDSDDGLPDMSKLGKNSRFAALVEKKRKEREAREAAEARKQAERAEQLATQLAEEENDMLTGDDSSNVTDDDGGRKLTQEVTKRPSARKASKKALEEMNRETQRLTRSLQLAHEAKTKKKITKAALFERFNFKPAGSGNEVAHSSSRPATPASAHHQSDVDAEMKEADQESDTPPSSPPVPGDAQNVEKQQQTEDEPLSLEDLAAAPKREKADKGKGKATAGDLMGFELEGQQQQVQQQTKPKRKLRVVKLPQTTILQSNHVQVDLDGDGDDDLVVEPTRKSRIDAIFDRVPVNAAREPRPLHMLRRLAHVDDPEKKVGAVPIGGPKAAKFRKEQPQQLMTVGELQLSLMQKARLQAKMERDRHLEMLRSKGIHVQTAEEREKEMELVEDIVAKARKEAEDIMQREREDAKADRKARRDAGEDDPLAWDDSEDDDDYQDPVEVEEKEVELSGSEEEEEVDEDMNDEGEEEEEEEEEETGVLIDGAAESADESDGEAEAEDGLPPPAQSSPEHNSDEEGEEELPTASKGVRRRRSRKTKTVTILSDDDDDEDEDEGVRVEATPSKKTVEATPRPKDPFQQHPPKSGGLNSSPKIPTSVLRSATKPFIPGLPVAGPAGLGLTQIFQGTMDSQGSQDGSPAGFKSPMPSFDDPIFPDSQFSQTAGEVVMDSQRQSKETQGETQGISQLKFNQSQAHGFDTFLMDNTQASELYKPTQDEGFRDYSPLKERFIELPQSTVSTAPLNETQEEGDSHSPLVQRTGRLGRRADLLQTVGEDEDEHMSDGEGEGGGLEGDEFGFGTVPSTNNNTAFNVMKEAARKEKQRKKMDEFDKKKSKAREMIEEQAEESEDEFAGLGGADGEDSDDDSDSHSVKEMIDDETKNTEGDDRKLAAYYADRERASDEKQVEKLFRDITSGMLRRKRNRDGGDFDLSDSDDGGEARRRMKRRQFQKMQRALFTDERISKVASNPRNSAFLRSIEDRGSDDDDEMDFILPTAAPAPTAVIPNSQPDNTNTGVSVVGTTTGTNTNPRRTTTKNGKKKPANLGEIRESLSNLLDEPVHASSVIPATELGSDDDDDSENDDDEPSSSNKENQPNTGSNPRRTTGGVAVVDRLTLKRNSSSRMSGSGGNKLAFAAQTAATQDNGGFKVPGLLRRATTNSSLISNPSNNNNTTTSSTGAITYNESRKSGGGGGVEGGGGVIIKKSAGKKSGISYLARENERRAAVAESERRREAKKWKGAENRVKVVGGLFGGGKFE